MKNSKLLVYLILILITYLPLDYFNILTRLNINIKNLNLEIINILVIIILYIITFNFIDSKQLKKEQNKVEISKIIFKSIYETCIENLELYTDEIIKDYIVPKCDFNKTINEDKFMFDLINQPFQNEKIISELLKDGVISKNKYENYLKSKESYVSYLTKRIILFDKPDFENEKEEVLLELKNSIALLKN
ncbi:hypothetical protein [Streptococcus marimammalium]|uniref:hypothetical protein n=1 Tax=Streptococcus marimammalium TaxID=269666 RepID=UPI00037AA20F|nr:hypothetical protein [Streptococcus marimammalium]